MTKRCLNIRHIADHLDLDGFGLSGLSCCLELEVGGIGLPATLLLLIIVVVSADLDVIFLS